MDILDKLIFNFLHSKYYIKFNKYKSVSLDDICRLIKLKQVENFTMPNAIKNANKNGLFLPFINGVLNTNTKELLPHSPDNYNTHIIPINYSKEDTIENTKFKDFLDSLTNNNSIRFQVLRACLYLIFTNN